MTPEKRRLDQRLVELGLAPTRQRAQSLILAGKVLVNDEPATKAGQVVKEGSSIRLRGEDHPYVSRGALKLKGAMQSFQVSCQGKVGLDVGASTGGFTQVLLESGASRVFSVDAGHNQMDWKIRSDPRVVVLEKVNARYLEFQTIGQRVDIIVVDVSFISLEKILPALLQFDQPGITQWITLIKPQFEAGREKVGKGGIVSDPAERQAVVDRITAYALSLGLRREGLIDSPITGTDGNHEYLALWRRSP